MIYSTHAIIFAMQERLSTGDLDPCLKEITEVSFLKNFLNLLFYF